MRSRVRNAAQSVQGCATEQTLPGWYPIQVKQKDKVGCPDIDAFEAVTMREDRTKGFFVAFDYTAFGGEGDSPRCRTGLAPGLATRDTAVLARGHSDPRSSLAPVRDDSM